VLSVAAALVCAALCVGLLRIGGFFSFLFLAPLAFAAYGWNHKTAWAAALVSALGNMLFSLVLSLVLRAGPAVFLWDLAFLTIITVFFVWIVAPPGELSPLGRIPGAYRLMAGSVLGFVGFLLLIRFAGEKAGFYELLRTQAEAMSSLYIASASADVVQRNLLERSLSPEVLIEAAESLTLRGGGLFSCAALFFLNRQLGFFLARVFRRREGDGALLRFHTPFSLIWVLSSALLLLFLSRRLNLGPLEIALWNVLVLCAMMYLAQGWGILSFFMAQRRAPPFLRMFFVLVLASLSLITGIYAVVLGLIVLLGIAENWVPFRVSRTNGPPPTPGV
jgi:hypothetical protein